MCRLNLNFLHCDAHFIDVAVVAGGIMFPGCPLPVRACVRAAPERRHSSIGLPSTSSYILLCLDSFYRAMLCIRGTSHGPLSVSVRPSVRHKSEFY